MRKIGQWLSRQFARATYGLPMSVMLVSIGMGVVGVLVAAGIMYSLVPLDPEGVPFVLLWFTLAMAFSAFGSWRYCRWLVRSKRYHPLVTAAERRLGEAPRLFARGQTRSLDEDILLERWQPSGNPGDHPLPPKAPAREILQTLGDSISRLERNVQRLLAACRIARTDHTEGPPPGWRARWLHYAIGRRTEQADAIARISLKQLNKTGAVVEGLGQNVVEIDDVVGLIGRVSRDSSCLALDAMINLGRAPALHGGPALAAQEAAAIAKQATSNFEHMRLKIEHTRKAADRTVALVGDVAELFHYLGSAIGEVAVSVEQHSHAARTIQRHNGQSQMVGPPVEALLLSQDYSQPSPPQSQPVSEGVVLPDSVPAPVIENATGTPDTHEVSVSEEDTLAVTLELMEKVAGLRHVIDGLMQRLH